MTSPKGARLASADSRAMERDRPKRAQLPVPKLNEHQVFVYRTSEQDYVASLDVFGEHERKPDKERSVWSEGPVSPYSNRSLYVTS